MADIQARQDAMEKQHQMVQAKEKVMEQMREREQLRE
jgi:hypothetical protein